MNTRISSRNRHIAPTVIGAGAAVLSSVMSLFGASAAQKQQRKQQLKAEQDALRNQFVDQRRSNANLFNEANIYGEDNVEYYANGGDLNAQNPMQNMTPEQQAILMQSLTQSGGKMPQLPISNGGFQTQGGNLVPIGNGVEKAVGNKHNETTIDGVSGIQLSQNGEKVAEIEDEEVLVDGDKVLSHQLKYDTQNSYAEKMIKLTKKRNKLEKEQEETNNKRTKNTIERNLAKLNMAEDTLFTAQEMHKMVEGKKELDTFAYGGKIKKLLGGGFAYPPYNRLSPFNKNLKKAVQTFAPNGEVITPFKFATTSLSVPANTDNNAMNNALGVSSSTPVPVTSPSTPAVPVASTPTTFGQKVDNFANSKVGSTALSLAPMLIDNIGNFFLTKKTPNLPTPLLNRAETLETRVNINPQLSEIRRTNKAMADNIKSNTSNSNNAKINLTAAALAGNRQVNELLGNKENQEITLRNADAQNKQMVNMQNTATMNQHAMNQYQRANDIRTQNSANLANLQNDIKTTMQMKAAKDNFDGYQLANLADDKLAEKANVYIHNKEFMNNPTYRDAILAQATRTDENGNYVNDYLRRMAIKLGYITE